MQELESSHCTADRCEGVLEMREEKKQLVAEIEDLTFQLNMVQEDLNVSQGKIEQLEVSILVCPLPDQHNVHVNAAITLSESFETL